MVSISVHSKHIFGKNKKQKWKESKVSNSIESIKRKPLKIYPEDKKKKKEKKWKGKVVVEE